MSFEVWLFTTTIVLCTAPWLAAPEWAWVGTPVLVAYLLRQLFLLIHLALLIRRHHRLIPPFPRGLWGEIYRSIAQYQQRGRKGRKRQIRFTRRFREAANAVPDGLVILDKQHRVEWANPAAATLMNVHWPEDDGRPLFEILNHPDLKDFVEVGESLRPMDFAPEHNRALMLSLRITPFGERKRQRLVVARDITKIYHLNMIRRDFVANASHELRTPLTVIAGFLESLIDASATPQNHRRPLSLMHNQAERMRLIIEDLLTLSRLEMHEHPEAQELVDVPDELHLILQEAHALSKGRHLFSTDVDENLLLLGSQPELRSAFSNLVFNAVKHTPEGTEIHVRWSALSDSLELRVEDNGPGIEPEHLPRLTERFYRIDKARSRESGGTGLGLAIVKHIMNRHDARLLIASEIGRGSTFSCVFPRARAILREEVEQATAPRAVPEPTTIEARSTPAPDTAGSHLDRGRRSAAC
ncbi:phosphate regulon sensor histidine kinase PhoR [Thiocapsa bogorovii]|uniref:phosphate regulon sensor histidine kinase PhoR n=1 Tax=Thiocapsa bogorovii TaxID=521689 RepID=UPI001E39E20D|nr:phosphate regulon sensor histidine kinase PhoR [Thiocapsa bogorovii]UHD14953.1 phosphate regulon sensor histidine kinase PhoR [Thiocapsa bogorovii]